MEAALELFVEKGFHAAPMSELARRAQVAQGTLYVYFTGKEALIRHLFKELEEKIRAAIEKDYPASRPLRERFLYLWKTLLAYAISNPLQFRYMEQYYNSPYGVSLRRDMVAGKKGAGRLEELLDEGVREGLMKDLPRPVLFALAFGPLITLARDHILGFVRLEEELIVRTAEACWEGIKK